ncbi:predicted protein [Streptomyces filamentosus NRRL 15998]|uniref:Predicted protein n=1 Tax=Streptomyces filamentosus NRRL 15998 TaxID=457431 RepID=D6AT25_STRFL|nr:predicted protein [Streptomyces filamentosus NRRL 15998]
MADPVPALTPPFLRPSVTVLPQDHSAYLRTRVRDYSFGHAAPG